MASGLNVKVPPKFFVMVISSVVTLIISVVWVIDRWNYCDTRWNQQVQVDSLKADVARLTDRMDRRFKK